MVAPTKIIAGLGMSLGIHVLDVPGVTGKQHALKPFAMPLAMVALLPETIPLFGVAICPLGVANRLLSKPVLLAKLL